MFSEDASDLVGNIKLVNKFYNINKKLACISDYEDVKNIYCEGLYDFTGEYQLIDDKGVLLTTRTLNVVPKAGGKYDIDNLLSEKFLFDLNTINPGVKLPSALFTEVEEDSVLVLETTDLFVEPSHRILFVLNDSTGVVLKFEQKNAIEVGQDGGLVIPKGNHLIKLTLGKNCGVFKEKGVRLIGYGFGLNTIFLE